MKLKLFLLAMLCIYGTLAPAAMVQHAPVTEIKAQTVAPANVKTIKARKLNFLQRWVLKLYLKKLKKANQSDADRQASAAQTCGVVSLTSLVLGVATASATGGASLLILWLVSFVLSIVAISKGNRALKNGTTQPKKAKAGKTLGTIVLVLDIIGIALGVIAAASLSSGSWGG